jgi:hypothetical protein
MSACLIKCEPDEPGLKVSHLMVKIYAFGKIHGSQAIGFFSEGFVARQVLRLSQQRVREINQTLHAVSRRWFGYP